MSRSRKKRPYNGIAGGSEKKDKRAYNRKLRRVNKELIKKSSDVLLNKRDVSDTWTMTKDGKFWFKPEDHPRLMRK